MIAKMEESLEQYKRNFAVMRHQQSLLYQDYHKDKKVCSFVCLSINKCNDERYYFPSMAQH